MIAAEIFGVEEHRFEGVSNLGAVARILRQAGLRTGRHRWHHDANADSGDNIQVGTIRFRIARFGSRFPGFAAISAAHHCSRLVFRRGSGGGMDFKFHVCNFDPAGVTSVGQKNITRFASPASDRSVVCRNFEPALKS